MADSLITIRLKLDALKIQVEPPKSTGSTPASSQNTGATQPTVRSGSAPDLGLDDIRKQFSDLATDLRAFKDAVKGITEIASILNNLDSAVGDLSKSFKQAAQEAGTSSTKSSGTSRAETTQDVSSARIKAEEAKKAAAADSEAAQASAKKADATERETQATKESADAAEDAAQAKKAEADAYARSNEGTSRTIRALAEIQAQWVRSASSTFDAAGAIEEYNKIIKASSVEQLNLSKSIGNAKSPISQLLESFFPVAFDKDFKARGQKLFETLAQPFVSFSKETDRTAASVKNLIKELNEINRTAAITIERDPSVSPERVISAARERSRAAVDRFNEGGGGRARLNDGERSAAISALSFTRRAEKIQESLNQLEQALAQGASELQKNVLVQEINVLTRELADQASRALGAGRSSPFLNLRRADGVVDNSPANTIGQSVQSTTNRELTEFQADLVKLTNELIKAGEATSVLPRVFRELAKDIGNFEQNQRVLKEVLGTQGVSPIGGVEKIGVAETVRSQLRTRIDASGALSLPTATDSATSFELLQANIEKLKQDLRSLGGDSNSLEKVFKFTDSAGNIRKVQVEVQKLSGDVDNLRVRAREVSTNLFDRTTVRAALSRIATWSAAAGIVFGVVNTFKDAVRTVIDTETSVVRLSKVMNESRADLEGFAERATAAGLAIAQDFGQPLAEVLETMITFAQQGLNFEEVEAGARASALASVVTTLNQPQAAEALTAATEQFGLSFTDATSIIDKFNNVANNAAVTETQLAEALKRAGIAATNAGVDLDQFNGIVAAISEQTRQSGGEIGTALRFIFSRLNTEEAERGLARVGVSVRDANGALRPFVEIIGELKDRFSQLSSSQQTQAAISLAGTRRFNTLLALLKNFDTFQKSVSNSVNSAGSSIEQQGQVAETTAFKVQQMKNAAAEAAIAFGATLGPAVETASEIAKGFFNVVSTINPELQTIIVGLGSAGVAFAKFSQTFAAIGDTAALPGGGVFRTLSGALTTGQSREQISQDNAGIATSIANLAGGGGDAVFAARSLGDFGKRTDDVNAFSKAIEGTGRVLVDLNGKQVENTKNLTKFTAVTRGYRTAAKDAFDSTGRALKTSNLGFLSLNTTVAKVAASIVGISNKIIRSIPLIGKPFDTIISKGEQASGRFGTLAGSVLRVTTAFFAVTTAIEAFGAARDFLTADGDSIAKGLEEEIAQRQKAIREIGKQTQEVDKLIQSRRDLLSLEASNNAQQPIERRESIRNRQFRSARLQEADLAGDQVQLNNQIGFVNPQFIDSIDEFGNVSLKASANIKALAEATTDLNERALALSQAKIAEGFFSDLGDNDGILKSFVSSVTGALDFLPIFGDSLADASEATKSAGTAFAEARDDLNSFLKREDVKDVTNRAAELGVSVSELNKGIGKELEELSEEAEKRTAALAKTFQKAIAAINAAPAGQSRTVLDKISRDALEQAAAFQSSQLGFEIDTSDFANRFAIVGTEAFKSLKNSIKFRAEDTKEALNQAGFIQQSLVIGQLAGNALNQRLNETLQAGDLVIVGNKQAEVEVNAFGDRVVRLLNEQTGKFETIRLADLIDASGLENIEFFDTQKITEAFRRTIDDINRIATGAGRGILNFDNIDLGSDFREDLTPQQRAVSNNETLFKDLNDANRDLTSSLEDFKSTLESGDVGGGGTLTTGIALDIAQQRVLVDEISTIAKFQVKIQEVGSEFEKASRKIQDSRLAENITREFDGVFGALKGAVQSTFGQVSVRSDLSAQQRSSVDNRDAISLGNLVSAVERTQGETLANFDATAREIERVAAELAAAGDGGRNDLGRLSQLVTENLDEANRTELQNVQKIQSDQLKEAQTQTDILRSIDFASKKGPDLILNAVNSSLGSGISEEQAIQAISKFSADQLSAIKDSGALIDVADRLGKNAPDNLATEAINRRIEARGTSLLSSIERKTLSSSGALSVDAAELLKNNASDKTNVSSPERSKALQEFVDASREAAEQLRNEGKIGRDRLNALKESISSNKDLSKEFKALSKELGTGAIESRLVEFVGQVAGTSPRPQEATTEEAGRNVQQEAKQAIELLNRQREAVESITNSGLFRNASQLAEAFALVSDAASRVEVALDKSLVDTINRINDSSLERSQGLAGDLTGALRGVERLSFDPGRSEQDLTARDVTDKQSQNVVVAANQISQSLQAFREQQRSVNTEIRRLAESRDQALSVGDTARAETLSSNIESITEAASAVGPKISESADALSKLGESLRRTDVINQFRLDIDKLVKSFKQDLDLQFDRTSIESAIGNTVFSLTRPTFEQFEQGQAGFATAFERAIADIDFKKATGQISFQEASRLENQAEFQRDEGVIQLAQERENRSFQIEVSAAEEIRKRLLEFSSSGVAGSGDAKALFDQLTSELESAGDIIQSSVGSRSVRNPLTGREEEVPASQILQFRGVQGLDRIQEQAGRIAQQAREEEQSKVASLTSTPIVNSLEVMRADLLTSLGAVKDAIEQPSRDASATTEIINALGPILTNAIEGSSASGVRRQDILNDSVFPALDRLNGDFSPEAVGRVASEVGGTDNLINILKEVSTSADSTADTVKKAEEALAQLGKTTEESSKQVSALAEYFKGLFSSFKDAIGGIASPFVQKRRDGGVIYGPGGPREDKVPVLASPGEFIVNAAAVKKFGLSNLEQINATGAVGRQKGNRFADGGFIFGEEEKKKALQFAPEGEDEDLYLTRLAAERDRAAGVSENSIASRGRVVRVEGPTGREIFEVDDEIDTQVDLRNRIQNAPTREELEDKLLLNTDFKLASANERNRIANLADDNRRRINGSGLNGKYYVKVEKDGTVVIRGNPGNGLVEAGGAYGNIDISSYKAFEADKKDRERRQERIANIPKAVAREDLQKRLEESEAKSAARENSIEDFARTRKKLEQILARKEHTERLSKSKKTLNNLLDQLSTAKGRDILRNEPRSLIEGIVEDAASPISLYTDLFSTYQPLQFQQVNPATQESVGPIYDLLADPKTAQVTPGVSLKGSGFYSRTPLVSEARRGVLLGQLNALQSGLEGEIYSQFDFGNFSALNDKIATSDLPTAAKAGLAVTSGFFNKPSQIVNGTVDLGKSLLDGTSDVIANTAAGDFEAVKQNFSNLKTNIKDAAYAASIGAVKETGESFGEFAAAIASGASDEEITRTGAKAGGGVFDVLAFASAKPVNQIKSLPNKVKNVGAVTTNKVRAAVAAAPEKFNKAKTAIVDKSRSAAEKLTDARAYLSKKTAEFRLKREINKQVKKATGVSDTNTIFDILDDVKKGKSAKKGPGLIRRGLAKSVELAGSAAASPFSIPAAVIKSPFQAIGALIRDPIGSFLSPFRKVRDGFGSIRSGLGSARESLGGFGERLGSTSSSVISRGRDFLNDAAAGIRLRDQGISPFKAPSTRRANKLLRNASDNTVDIFGRSSIGKVVEGFNAPDFIGPIRQNVNTGGFGAAGGGGTSLFNQVTSPGFFRRKLNEFRLAREISSGNPVAPGRASVSEVSGPRGSLPTPDGQTNIELFRQTTGFRDFNKAREALKKAGIEESEVFKLADASLEDRAAFRNEFRRFITGRNELGGRTPEFIGQSLNRAKLRNSPGSLENLKATRERLRGDLSRRKQAEQIQALKQAAKPFDPNATGAFNPSARNRGPANISNLSEQQIVDALLGTGSYDLLIRDLGPTLKGGKLLRDDVLEELGRGEGAADLAEVLSKDLETAKARLNQGPLRQSDLGNSPFSKLIGRRIKSDLGLDFSSPIPLVPPAIKEAVAVAGEIPTSGGKRIITPEGAANRKAIEQLRERQVNRTIVDEPSSPGSLSDLEKSAALFKERFGKIAEDEIRIRPDDALRKILKQQGIDASDTLIGQLRKIKKFATGGFISGPGGPTSDQVPILASNGEFVINAATVKKLGVPFFESLNNGTQTSTGSFQNGGVVTRSSSAGGSTSLSIDTDSISSSISKAITSAIEQAEFPMIEIDTEGVSVPLDAPESIPLDASSIPSLGENLGSGLRNRLESIEGTVESLREDTNSILDVTENINVDSIKNLISDVDGIKVNISAVEAKLVKVEEASVTQKQEILNEVFTLINEQINNISIENTINTKIDSLASKVNYKFVEVEDRIKNVVVTAELAMVEALSRR